MNQKQRDDLAVKVSKLLNRAKPRPDIFDCLDILRNLEDSFISELKYNIEDD